MIRRFLRSVLSMFLFVFCMAGIMIGIKGLLNTSTSARDVATVCGCILLSAATVSWWRSILPGMFMAGAFSYFCWFLFGAPDGSTAFMPSRASGFVLSLLLIAAALLLGKITDKNRAANLSDRIEYEVMIFAVAVIGALGKMVVPAAAALVGYIGVIYLREFPRDRSRLTSRLRNALRKVHSCLRVGEKKAV